MPLTLPGSLHPGNKGAIAWGEKGILLYGSHCTLVVLDVLQNRIIQTLEKHSSPISHISCSPEEEFGFSNDPRMRCASADVSGVVVIWDLLDGVPVSSFSNDNSSLTKMEWFPWEDASRDFLLVLYSPGNLILWNTITGHRIWSVTYPQTLVTITIDPFDLRNAVFGTNDGSLFAVDNLLLHKAPSGRGNILAVFGQPVTLSQIQYHQAFANILFASTLEEIVCVETEYRCVIWRTRFESELLRFFVCSERDVLVTVHTTGLVTFRIFSVSEDEKGHCAVNYDAILCSDTQRQTPHHRIISAAFCPVTQSTVALLYNSGNIALYQMETDNDDVVMPYRSRFITDLINVDESNNYSACGKLKLTNIAQIFSLGQGATTVRMRPIDSAKDGDSNTQLAAIGSALGIVRLVDLASGSIQKELHIHSCSIKCLDWGGLNTLVSAAYVRSLSTSNLVKNDILVTDIRTGESKQLRPEVEETPVEMLRVSFYHCYIAVGFRNEPLEIWHLKSLRLLRRMSRACPVIIDMAWSGKHHAAKKIVEGGESVFRENLVVLDEECHLYHVVVKGLHVRDGKEVNSQWKSGAAVKCLVWKDDLLAMGDAWGRLGVWDLGKRQCHQTRGSSRGSILKIVFSRLNDDHTLAVLHQHSIAIWDADELILLQQHPIGGEVSFLDLDLYNIFPVAICSDNSFRYFPSVIGSLPVEQCEAPLLLDVEPIDALNADKNELHDLFNNALNGIGSSDTNGLILRHRVLHRLFGNRWLYDLWSLIECSLLKTSLSSRLYLFWGSEFLRRRAEQMLSCLMCLTDLNSAQIDILVHQAVVLQKRDWAMQLLLGFRDECRMSALRACLLAADVTSEGAQSIIKLIATNLIANECMTDGVQMLFLIGHGNDGCRYLQAHGCWNKSLYFAKLGLNDWTDVGNKWLEHLLSSKAQKSLSCLLAANMADWDRLAILLAQNSKNEVAQQVLDVLTAHTITVAATTTQIVYTRSD